jgi:N-methylhydantoinase B
MAVPCGGVVIEPGESLVAHCCGGGGYGPPLERDPALVRRDVKDGWITAERAREVYGIAQT